jgi:hypothetical protein
MSAKGTSTKEEFEVVKFVEDKAPFTMFLEKTCIERD